MTYFLFRGSSGQRGPNGMTGPQEHHKPQRVPQLSACEGAGLPGAPITRSNPQTASITVMAAFWSLPDSCSSPALERERSTVHSGASMSGIRAPTFPCVKLPHVEMEERCPGPERTLVLGRGHPLTAIHAGICAPPDDNGRTILL